MQKKPSVFNGLWLISIAMIFSCFLSVANASTFFPDPEDGRDSVMEEIDFSEYIFSDDDDLFFIDDMAFRKSDVQRSGFTGQRWPDGNVYYEFDPGVSSQNRTRWLEAAYEWRLAARVQFIQRTSQLHYIYIKNDPENWSLVGMQGGKQEMGIASWGSKFVIAHEIGHALGMIHEHQRVDRGLYITINQQNIQTGYYHNFVAQTADLYDSYDFDSVMHYDKCAFSIDCPTGATCDCNRWTIVCNDGYFSWTYHIGQRDHLSDKDKNGMATRYGPPINTPTPFPTLPPTFPPFTPPWPTNTPWPTPLPTSTMVPWPTSTPDPFTPTPDCINNGDVNQDGRITSADAQLAFLITLGHYTPTHKEECSADCNGDARVTSADAQLIFQAGLGTAFCADPL